VANDQEVGSLVVALKAQIEGLEKGFAKAKETLKAFGGDVEKTAVDVNASGKKISEGFEAFSRRESQVNARLVRLTARLITLQFALTQLKELGGTALKAFSVQTTAAANALGTFASFVAIAPNKFGLMLGAVGGLAAGFRTVQQAIQETEERAKKFVQNFAKNFRAASEAAGSRNFEDLVAGGPAGRIALEIQDHETRLKKTMELRQVFVNQIAAIENKAQNDAEATEKRKLELVKERARLEDQIQVLSRIAGRGGDAAMGSRVALDRVNAQLAAIAKEAAERQKKLEELRGQLASLGDVNEAAEAVRKLNEQLANRKALDDYIKSMSELRKEAAGLETAVNAGVVDPVKAAEIRIDLANKKIQILLDNLALLKNSPEASGDVVAAIKKAQLELADAQFAFAFAQDDANKPAMQTALKLAEQRRAEKAAKELEERVEGFNSRFTDPFADAVGSAVADGIMRGAPAMETLANVGRNLFSNFLNDSIINFRDGMAAAFQGIAGVGGEALGSLFTGVVGILGAVFANSKSKSSESFTGVRDNIESTQAVRGIVAGPSSVAIAAVGENLARAMAPVVQRLDAVVTILVRVEKNTRGGPAGGGSDLSAVGVPTSFASA
jgi:predicted metal-dependent phosphoesterase TrpH